MWLTSLDKKDIGSTYAQRVDNKGQRNRRNDVRRLVSNAIASKELPDSLTLFSCADVSQFFALVKVLQLASDDFESNKVYEGKFNLTSIQRAYDRSHWVRKSPKGGEENLLSVGWVLAWTPNSWIYRCGEKSLARRCTEKLRHKFENKWRSGHRRCLKLLIHLREKSDLRVHRNTFLTTKCHGDFVKWPFQPEWCQ